MATRYWLGAAVAIPEVYTISITGTWTADDTCYLELNGKQLVLTVGAAVTIDDIGAALVAMINGDSAVGTETRSAVGTSVGEFAALTASWVAADDNLVITGKSNGRPVGTLSVGETTASTGALAIDGAAVSTAGTGPHDWDNVDNWDADTVPVNADTVIFDHRASASVLFNLSQTLLTIAQLTITNGFRYAIGLPEVNTDVANAQYDEHQETFLSLAAGTVMDIDASSAGSIKIDLASTDTTTTVTGSGASVDTNQPPVQLNINNPSADLHVLGGNVGLCTTQGTSGQVDRFTCGGSSASRLAIGSSVTLATGTVSSGKVTVNGAITTIYINGGEFVQTGSGTIDTVNLNDGVFWDISTGTVTNVLMTGGRYDKSLDNRSKTITNFTIYARAHVKDPIGALTITNGLDIYPQLMDVTLDLPTRRTYTITAI